jgi:hypothetical protein
MQKMSDLSERKLGWLFGLLGGLLIVVAALIRVAIGAVDLAVGSPGAAVYAGAEAVLLLVVGGLALFFSWLAYEPWSSHPITAGVVLLVIAFVGWAVLGLGGSLLALIGAVFVLVAAILFLVQPALSGVRAVATA